MIDIGDPVPNLSVTITDPAGAPANAGAVTCTITLPDGTTATPTVSNTGTGLYSATYITTQAGRHSVRWEATGVNASAYTDAFDVDASASAIVSLADVKAHLNITSNTSDDELRLHIEAASEWVESKVGPVARRTVTETVTGSGETLILNHAPVISLTSVTSAYGYAGTYDTAGMYLDGPSGIVRYGATELTWTYPVSVTYVAGRTVVPAAIRLATLIMVKAFWETQRGASPLPLPGSEELEQTPGVGMAVWRAERLLEPYRMAPSVA